MPYSIRQHRDRAQAIQDESDAELELARQAADGVSGPSAKQMAMCIEIVERRKKEIEAKKLVHLAGGKN